MPRRKKDVNPNAIPGVDGIGSSAVASDPHGLSGLSSVPAVSDRTQLACFALDALTLRSDGWVRIIPCGDGKLSYYKYKYATGQHKGKYVMYVAPYNNWAEGVLGLYEKVGEVDLGARKPAQDTFYDPR